jgi:hypothetical protein
MTTRIEDATERLLLAIERLERAMSRSPQSDGERERLSHALAAVEADQAALQRVADTVASRLDLAIGRLKLILGN